MNNGCFSVGSLRLFAILNGTTRDMNYNRDTRQTNIFSGGLLRLFAHRVAEARGSIHALDAVITQYI